MYNSLKKLLRKFPYFVTREKGSNQFKSETVFNEEFKQLYQAVNDVFLSKKLNKHILIHKEQYKAFEYVIHFYVSLPHLKKIQLFKNDDVDAFFIQEYNLQNTNEFKYDYYDVSSEEIPSDCFRVIVETYDEFIYEKGYPQMVSTDSNNIYSIDTDLDDIGALFNFSRLHFTRKKITDYSKTYPPFSTEEVENDYLYMKRLLFFIQHMYTVPLPLLRLYNLFNIPPALNVSEKGSRLVNRESKLCKMIDDTYHDILDFTPQKWEHKDVMCAVEHDTSMYSFFVSADTNTPLVSQDFSFKFEIRNEKMDIDEKTWYILPFVKKNSNKENDTVYKAIHERRGVSTEVMTFNTAEIDNVDSEFIFKAFNSESLLYSYIESNKDSNGDVLFVIDENLTSEPVKIKIASWESANWFVSTIGDDNNDGATLDTAFRTIEKAISVCHSLKNTIAVENGNYTLIDTVQVPVHVNMLGHEHVTIESACQYFFEVKSNSRLNMSKITLKTFDYKNKINYASFVNENKTSNSLFATTDAIILVADATSDAEMIFKNDETNTIVEMKKMKNKNPKWDIDISDEGEEAYFEIRPDGSNSRLIVVNQADIDKYKEKMRDEHEKRYL